jgi:LPXTG-site transpeptidase (sortase) family protein
MGRALLALAALSLVGAGVLVRVALRDDVPEATLQVTSAIAAATPSTIAPSATVVPPAPPATDVGSAPASTLPVSPLAAQLGERGSAIPRPPSPRVAPATVTIDDIELWAPIRSVGLDDNGEMEIPDETEVGWYDLGAAPGEEGATVLAAHVTWNDTVGPFYRLGDLEPGAQVRVRLGDDTTRVYEVVERTMYAKDELPDWRIFRRSGPESLVLITCGGSFNPQIRRYRHNIVVYAVPVATEPVPATGQPG